MITKLEAEAIRAEVQTSIIEALDFVKARTNKHNYILLLADGEYKEKFRNTSLRLNPYVIDYRDDAYKDKSRLDFLTNFMNAFYSFDTPETRDTEQRLHTELMIYTHIWESKPFLKQLYRLAHLTTGQQYLWSVTVPEMSKHTFIRNDIRDTLANNKLSLSNVISKGFHTSLRNAFAHSEYQFDEQYKSIFLDTYTGKPWDIESITYDAWTRRFLYSTLLSYHLLQERYAKRQALIKDFGTDEYLIVHPITERRFKTSWVKYNMEHNNFYFIKR